MSELESSIKELLSLAKRKPLSGEDLERAKHLMVRLRRMGWTNKEVSELTDGGWSEPSVKNYTRGTKVENPGPKEKASRLLPQLVERGLTLENVETTVSMKKDLDAKGVSFEDISSLLEEAKRFKVGVKELSQMHRGLRDSRLTISQLSDILSYMSEISKTGFTIDGLKEVSKASEAYGGYHEVLEAINAYGSIKEMEEEAEGLDSENEKLEKRIVELKSEVEDLEKRRAQISTALELYENLKSLGFEEANLRRLQDLSAKYGGVESVLEAVKAHTNISELKSRLDELEKEKARVKNVLEETRGKYAHIQPVIKLCEELLYKYGFSIEAVERFYELAKKHGNPYELTKALGAYTDLNALQEELESVESKKSATEARLKETEARVQELREASKELKDSAKKLIKPLFTEIGRGIKSISKAFDGSMENITSKHQEHLNTLEKAHEKCTREYTKTMEKITTTYEENMNVLKKGYEDYAERLGELKAEAGKLEEDLDLARVVNSIIKYPSKAKELPIDYSLLLQETVAKLCKAKGLNPKVKAGDIIYGKYYISSSKEVELLDIIDWAIRGLQISLE